MKIVDPRVVLPPDPPDLDPPKTLENPSAAVSSSPQISVSPTSISASVPPTATSSYAERFKASLRNLKKISSPDCVEDGAPVV